MVHDRCFVGMALIGPLLSKMDRQSRGHAKQSYRPHGSLVARWLNPGQPACGLYNQSRLALQALARLRPL
jgi:hypothetical protein